jgi:hypothetical protein
MSPGARVCRHWLWQAVVRTTWMLAVPIAMIRGPWILGVTTPWEKLPDQFAPGVRSDTRRGTAFSVIVIWKSRRPGDSAFRRRNRQWYLAIVCALFRFSLPSRSCRESGTRRPSLDRSYPRPAYPWNRHGAHGNRIHMDQHLSPAMIRGPRRDWPDLLAAIRRNMPALCAKRQTIDVNPSKRGPDSEP